MSNRLFGQRLNLFDNNLFYGIFGDHGVVTAVCFEFMTEIYVRNKGIYFFVKDEFFDAATRDLYLIFAACF